MSLPGSTGYAFNRTRQAYLATHVTLAATHWSRFRGLMCIAAAEFRPGNGLWIVPCRGVHTFAMNFPIDVLYLDRCKCVVHIEQNLRPWRLAKVSLRAASVLELPADTLRSSPTAVGDEIDIEMGQAGEASTA
jgi:uncharacterized membrane protein (UPF0127 family)